VPRADLSAILCDAARDDAEFLFGDSITALRQDTGGVDVTFKHAAPRRFDLVVGADRLHSSVRTLVFGPEADFVRHLRLYVATLPLDRPAADPATILMYNAPSRSLTPGRDIGRHPRGPHRRLPRLRNPPPQGERPESTRPYARLRAACACDTYRHYRPQPHRPSVPTRADPTTALRGIEVTGAANASAGRTRRGNRHTGPHG